MPLPAGLTAGGGFFPAFGGRGAFALWTRKRRRRGREGRRERGGRGRGRGEEEEGERGEKKRRRRRGIISCSLLPKPDFMDCPALQWSGHIHQEPHCYTNWNLVTLIKLLEEVYSFVGIMVYC